MDTKRFKKFLGGIEKREVPEEVFKDAVKEVLLSDTKQTSSINRSLLRSN